MNIYFTSQWRVTGVSGQAGADARVDVEDIRAGGEFVTTPPHAMEARTVVGNGLRVRRETALNVKITLTGVLLEVQEPPRKNYPYLRSALKCLKSKKFKFK